MSGSAPQSPYEAVVFAAGGCRCFWQAGFWAEAAPALHLTPRVVGGVSAGAAFACAVFAGVVDRVVEEFCRRIAVNERNAYPSLALRGAPVFPHEQIYRSTICASLDGEALARLHSGPDIRVSVARPPAWSGARGGLVLGALAYLAEQSIRGGVHSTWGRRIGFRSETVSVRECRNAGELTDLILHSSCTPPITPLYRRAGRPVLDGGVYDFVPVEAVEPARTVLVLLTRPCPEDAIPRVEGRSYVMPSRPVPVAKWDYTSPELVRRTFDLGRSDGEAFARRLWRRDAA